MIHRSRQSLAMWPIIGLLATLGLLAGLVLVPAEGRADGRRGVPAAAGRGAGLLGSGWQAIDLGETLTFDHNLGGSVSDYAVQLWFWDMDGGVSTAPLHRLWVFSMQINRVGG